MIHVTKKFALFLLAALLLMGCQPAQAPATEGTEPVATSADADTEPASPTETSTATEKKTVTVTTSFLADMVRQLAGDLVEIDPIIPAGEDPHMYLAKPQDLEKLTQADLVLYHGLDFEGKMIDALQSVGHAVADDLPQDALGTMEDEGETVLDPHFWFNLDLYAMAVENAAGHLKALMPEHADTIKTNSEAYKEQLKALHEESKVAIDSIPKDRRYLITPHDAFLYFSRAYDIPVRAPQGISTDSEVAAKDIDETVDFLVEHRVKAIFAESTTDPARMEKLRELALRKGWDVEVVHGDGRELYSDSLAPSGQPGDTFIDMFRHNVQLIVDHLK